MVHILEKYLNIVFMCTHTCTHTYTHRKITEKSGHWEGDKP